MTKNLDLNTQFNTQFTTQNKLKTLKTNFKLKKDVVTRNSSPLYLHIR
jgi:hypothetical protein